MQHRLMRYMTHMSSTLHRQHVFRTLDITFLVFWALSHFITSDLAARPKAAYRLVTNNELKWHIGQRILCLKNICQLEINIIQKFRFQNICHRNFLLK